ncbi:MAG: hypothetical protein ALECFALPRED_000704 [Alectoria fallacina]|uniref:Carboxymuconolactone decarboxylase-like domain-containing protein n=1 Tax=Alectoria fallacina TaxID=1903189 RepID=A0A8H3J9X5_9LECA|nr:MAG: hypothetical protein ALECFALPRED_000704 [Alectoria fallacina]
MSSSEEPTVEEAKSLFEKLAQKFPSKTLGVERWYLVAIAALTGGGQPEFAGSLYTHLIEGPRYATSEARQALVRRLREALVKSVSIIGVCRPLEAIFNIDAAQRPEDKDYSFSRENWQSGPENHARGVAWLDKIYKQNRTGTINSLAAHKDFAWISANITYGLYLSDRQVLDDIDTEMVVLSGIMIQNLKRETGWHLRGTRRVGVSHEDVEMVQQCIEMVAAFAGIRLNKIPRVADIEHEV